MTPEELQKRNELAFRRAELAALEPITFEQLEAEINKWLLIADKGVVKFLCGFYVSNQLSRDPLWAFLIGPSGGGKTELVTAMLDLELMYPVSLITPQTFLSGMPGPKDTSLLPMIDKKTLVFLDWTNLLSMNKDARNEIMGQLRDIYGGYLKKVFGNGKIREWTGKIGLIACVTEVIDMQQQMNASLGERFIHYHLKQPNRIEVALRSLENGDQMPLMRKELRNAFYAFFKGLGPINQDDVKLSLEIRQELVRVTNFITMARSGVIRDFGFKKEVIFAPSPEMPTRVTQQLNTLAQSLVIVLGEKYQTEIMELIYKIALDSIPKTNKMVCIQLAQASEQTTKEIATSLGYPTGPIHMYLENMAMLGVCKRIQGKDSEGGGNADKWTLDSDFVDILKTYDFVPDNIAVSSGLPSMNEEEQNKLLDEVAEQELLFETPEQQQEV